MSGDQAWVTLATNDSYALGALVVARSLRRVNTSKQLVVMITPGVTGPMREALTSEFDAVSQVNVLDSEDTANLALLTRPELGITFTKLHCWKLTQFSKCVFLDADTLILQNCDELFDREEFSAAPDVGWPDCFNSGVFVFKPSIDTYNRLLAFAVSSGSFDGGDQGLLNSFFNDWSVSDISKHLPFIYNMVASATYSYLPAFRVFGANVKIAHFIGAEKPWLMYFDSATGTVRAPSGQEHLQELLQAWWDIFRADVHRKLSPDMGGDTNLSATMVEQAGLAGAFAKMSLEGSKSNQLIEFEEQMRKHAWESGHIDYMGKDSFDNIMKKINASMAQPQAQPTAAPEKPKEKSPSPPKVTEVPPPKPDPVPAATPESQPQPAAPAPVPEATARIAPKTVPEAAAPVAPKTIPEAAAPVASETVPEVTAPVAPKTVPEAATPVAPKTATEAAAPVVPKTVPEATQATAPPSVPVQTVPVVVASEPEKISEELEEARLAEERQALEKKLAEQKRIAEQKLEQEKQAAEARAAAGAQKAAAPKPTETAPPKAAAQPQEPASAPPTEVPAQLKTAPPQPQAEAASPAEGTQPVAPPRRQSKVEESAGGVRGLRWNNIGYRVGLGLSCVAVVAYAIYSASASTSPVIGGGLNHNED